MNAQEAAGAAAGAPMEVVSVTEIVVVNKHRLSPERQRAATYVGRGSPLGNPFKVRPYGPYERGETIGLYERHLRDALARGDEAITRAIASLVRRARAGETLELMCFCAPRACHADVIARVVRELARAQGEGAVVQAGTLARTGGA